MIVLRFIFLLILVTNINGLGLSQLLSGLKPSNSASNSATDSNMILCTVRHAVHYAQVYDTVLVDKCFPTSGGSSSGGGLEKQCTSKIETVYENECTTEKDQSCTTVYDTTYEDSCQTEYVRICGGFQPVGGGYGGSGGGGYGAGGSGGYGGGGGYGGIHRSFDTETFDNNNDTIDLQDASRPSRKRRSAYQSGYGGGNGGCTKIPQQKCNKIPHKTPRRQCNTVDKPSCHSTPRQVHKQECSDVPSSSSGKGQAGQLKCHKVQRKVPRLIGHKVPQKHCEALNQNINGQGIRLVGVFNNAPSTSLLGGGSSYGPGPVLSPSSTVVHPSGYF